MRGYSHSNIEKIATGFTKIVLRRVFLPNKRQINLAFHFVDYAYKTYVYMWCISALAHLFPYGLNPHQSQSLSVSQCEEGVAFHIQTRRYPSLQTKKAQSLDWAALA